MRAKLRVANTPVKLIAVVFFAILVPSVLVTSLGLVAVFQADGYVRDSFTRPLREKVNDLRAKLAAEWTRRLHFYSQYLEDAEHRPFHVGELRSRDPLVKEVLVSGYAGLDRAPDPPPPALWAPNAAAELKDLHRLEVVEKDHAAALAEARRILASDAGEAIQVEALLAAARLSHRLGRPDEAMAQLHSALDRFGHTADAAGVVRALPILARLGEVEKEVLGGPRKETVRSLFQALERYREVLAADAAAFYGTKARELSPDVSAEPRPAPAGALTAEDIAELAPVLERQVGGGAPWLERHPSLSGSRRLDFVTFPHGSESAVHLLLDREAYQEEARALAAASGLEAERLRFASSAGPAGPFTTPLPAPLANLELDYSPPPGVLPEGFRGFQVISLAAFTWAVILLVVTILVGVLFTLRSVLREMRTARLKSDFVSFVSHELKTPLTAIRMFTETMLAGRITDEEEKRFCIQMIDRESERLAKLVEQVLEYSRIEKHEKEFRFMSCDMEDVVREAVKLFKEHNRLDSREVEINSVQRISKIKMDREAMIELLLNLLSNAAKYSSRDKKIILNLRESIDDITVEVVDQGVGIRKRDQKKIFEKFYRAEDYLTREVEGTGLGLTFARYIAKVHNGDIKVSSQVANGSTFTLQLRKSHVLAE